MTTPGNETGRATWGAAFAQCKLWLGGSIADFRKRPLVALAYGTGFVGLGYAAVWSLFYFSQSWMLLPVLAGAILIAPMIASGLYSEARRLKFGCKCKAASPLQLVIVGTIVLSLFLVWLRAAELLFAIFFGLQSMPGSLQVIQEMLTTPGGIFLLAFTIFVGGLFAAFTLAISFFSLPMLADKKIDAFSAMGHSFSACGNNFKQATAWGICVTTLMALGMITGLVGLIIIFPILAFATWHAYEDFFGERTTCPGKKAIA